MKIHEQVIKGLDAHKSREIGPKETYLSRFPTFQYQDMEFSVAVEPIEFVSRLHCGRFIRQPRVKDASQLDSL
jgi:hypothetical protein